MAHHGNTPAAWTLVVVVLVGFSISGAALMFENALWFWIGVAVLGIGIIAGKVLQLLGFGAESTRR